MKPYPQMGLYQHSALISAQLKNDEKLQMKRSQTSERKNTQMSLIFHLFFLCLILSLLSCSGKSDFQFKDSADALKQYRDFHHSIAEEQLVNSKRLSEFICRWQELSDTVFNYIKKDPAFSAHAYMSISFQDTSDSVRVELLRLASDCTLSDVAYVKMHTSPYRTDSKLDITKKKAATFFSSLGNLPIYTKGNAHDKVLLYRNFLAATKEHGINNQRELLSFIETEDRHFRTFISNIGDYTDVGMEEITKMTESICADLFHAASENRLTSEDAIVYMGMRTCRRLLLNAQVCNNLIKAGKIKSEGQANAYLWMTLQPFLSMDALTISMLTKEQQKQMEVLAASYPKISERLAAKGYADSTQMSKIPAQLMRLYIAVL